MITWLASYPKSGNTWVRYLLNAYLNGSIEKLDYAQNDNHEYYYTALSPKKDITPMETLAIRSAALFHMAHNSATTLKTHHANAILQGFPVIPRPLTKRAIYIVRDPRDVVLSAARHFGISIEEAVDSISDDKRSIETSPTFHYLGTWSFHVNSWIDAEFPVHVIRYEDLISNTHNELKRLLPFLDILPDDQRIDLAVNLTDFQNLQDMEARIGFREKSSKQDVFFKHKGSRWKQILTKAQVDKIVTNHGDTMLKLGYEIHS